MSYTPINQAVFIRAYTGALAGMGITNRDVAEVSELDHAFYSECAIAAVFAQQFDTQLNSSGLSALGVLLVQTLSQEYWSGRQPMANPVFLNPLTYLKPIESLITAIANSVRQFGLTGVPQTDPGTGAATPTGVLIVERHDARPAADIVVTGPPTFRELYPALYFPLVLAGDVLVITGFASLFGSNASTSVDFQFATSDSFSAFASGARPPFETGPVLSCDCRSPLQHYQEAFNYTFRMRQDIFDLFVTSQFRSNNSGTTTVDQASLISGCLYRGANAGG